MKIIETISEQVSEEINDARKYAKLALELKESMPELAKSYIRLSLDEMEHQKVLHESVAAIIKDYRKENGEPPAAMLAVYDYLHKKQIEAAAEVKSLQEMY